MNRFFSFLFPKSNRLLPSGFLFFIASVLSCFAQAPATFPAPVPFSYLQPLTPRHQWNANSGYCGETCFITAGMGLGQYASQFTVRELASPGMDQHDIKSQLLLGVNAGSAARKMRLDAVEFYTPTQRTTREFLAWVKSNTLAGNTVIIGVFNNGIILDEWQGRRGGDTTYDHIVTVIGWGSHRSLEAHSTLVYPSDVILIDDNGLFGTPQSGYPFLFPYRVRHFPGTRFMANNPFGPVYMLKNLPPNYGIAVQGVLDLDEVTIPVSLQASRNDEPLMPHGSNVPPPPAPLVLTATVHIPDPSKSYNLYLYDDFQKVPVANFNAASEFAAQSWEIAANSGGSFVVEWNTMTDQTVVFRAVPTDAP